MAESLLKADEVARLLNVKVSTVYAAAAAGRIPCVRLWEGQRRALIRFRAEDIGRLIDGRARGDRGPVAKES